MKKPNLSTLVLAFSAVLLLGAAPVIAHAETTTTTKSSPAKKKTAAKKPAAKTTAHKAVKKKTTSAATVKKTVSKTTTVKKATPVVLSAPSPIEVTPPTMTTTASAHPRSMAEMAKPPAKGGQPKQVVQSFYNELLGAMKQADALGFNGRSQKMQALLDQSFNVNDMMRTAAGPAWGTASGTQQQQMVQSFRAFTAATYASRFSKYGGEQFQIMGEKPGLAANETIVETQLVENSGEKTDLNYLLRRDGSGHWRIVDVYVDGTISEMAARRSEFGSVLRRDGVDALLKLMDEKSRSLASS